MVITAIVFPNFDPVAFYIGPLMVRWYSLAYIAGILLALWVMKLLNTRLVPPAFYDEDKFDDIIIWGVLGIIIGGRLGYVLFYDLMFVKYDYLRALRIWEGGMSFHGGIIGVAISLWLFCRKRTLNFLRIADLISCGAPIGLFLGRIANFINGELYGRPTNASWGIIFPYVDMQPRHPSQLYEAILEGMLLFIIMWFCFACQQIRQKEGTLSGIFLVCYSIMRMAVEHYYREPDTHIGMVGGMISMGEILSLPMLFIGIWLISRRGKK